MLDSPFAIAFLKHFVFTRETSHESPPFDGDLARIRASLADLCAKQAHPLYFEDVFTQSVVRELMSEPNRDSSKAQELLRMIQELRPKVLTDSGLTGLELLARFDDPKLNPTTAALSRMFVGSSTAHPAALFYAAQFFEKTDRQTEALHLLQRLADSEFEDDELTLDACIRMGDHFAETDPKRARDYYWRAVRIGFASPTCPRVKMDRAIALLNALDHR